MNIDFLSMHIIEQRKERFYLTQSYNTKDVNDINHTVCFELVVDAENVVDLGRLPAGFDRFPGHWGLRMLSELLCSGRQHWQADGSDCSEKFESQVQFC